MKKDKILKISILLLGIVAIFLIIGITYAYFSSTHQGEEGNILSSSCFNLELEADNIISEGNIPMTDVDAKKTTPYIFTIKNICKTSAEVGVDLDILKTTTANLSNYKVSITNGVTVSPILINDLESDEIVNNDTLLTKKLTNVYVRGNSEKVLELRLWMKDSVGVGEGENEIIESKISLTATAVPVELNSAQEKIIADNGGIFKVRGKKEVDLKESSPAFLYQEQFAEYDNEIALGSGTNVQFANSYSFNPETKIYTLDSPVSEPLAEKHIGMYTCNSDTRSCETLYKIKEVNINLNKETYSISDPIENTLSVTSTLAGNRTFGKSFHIDEGTGKFVLDEMVTKVNYIEDYIGYYACGTSDKTVGASTSCTTLYQIKEVQSDPGEGTYYSKETLNSTVSLTSTNNKTVSNTYDFDNETGTFTLTSPISDVSYSSDYVGYYTCNTNATTCTTLYKINEVTDSKITNADKFVKTTRYHRLKKADLYSAEVNNSYITLSDMYTSIDYDYVRNNTGLYISEDDFGDTYYFRGGNDWNNIYFAGYYWNIVRINGDGSLRLIYRGTTPTANGFDSQIEASAFNTYNSYGYNAYVGFMYGESLASSYALEHTNTHNSTIKEKLDLWYEKRLLNYNDYIADSIFCNDRSLSSGSGYYWSTTYYKGMYRTEHRNDLSPTFKCDQKNDRFTVSNNYGNQNSKYPIGLLTVDEVSFAGIYNTTASTYNYLNIGIDYWTMTPSIYNNNAYVYYVSSIGNMNKDKAVNNDLGVRPVINLKGNVILSGTGTIENPYVVEGLN